MFDIPCIIFAGGRSSRMGEDKALLPFDSYPTLTQYQLHKLQKIFKKVYISCKKKSKFNFEANFIEDIESDNIFAPTTGFLSIFNHLTDQRFFVISVDTPFVTQKEIEALINKDDSICDATVAKTTYGIQPMCGIYHSSLKNKFLEMFKTNNHKLNFLLKNSNTNYTYFEDEQPFLNLNNPDEYKKALTLI